MDSILKLESTLGKQINYIQEQHSQNQWYTT